MRKIIIALLAALLVLCAGALAEEIVQIPIVTVSAYPVGDGSITPPPPETPEPTPKSTQEPAPTPAPTDTPAPEEAPVTEPVETSASGTLMVDNQTTSLSVGGIFSSSSTVLGSEVPRASITSIRFESSLAGAPAGAWDVSAERNGSVLAWVTNGALTIAGEGGVRANPDSSHLFAGYSAVESIDFNNCFNTEDATNMAYMFSSCLELTSLNLAGFHTANVTNMEGMFFMDTKLEALSVDGFNTSAVSSMRSMFESCTALKSLDLTSFNTSAAADMRWMFSGCAAMEQISVSSGFAEGKNTADMFSGCPASLATEGGEVNTEEWSKVEKYVSLKLWSRGEEVRWLQTKLSELGYSVGFADGVLGPNTVSALKKWQRDHGYEATGVTEAEQIWELMK